LHERKKNLRNILRHAIHRVWMIVWKKKLEQKTMEFVQKKKKQKAKEDIQKAFSQVRERLYIISVLRNNKASTDHGDDVAAKALVDKYMETYGKVEFTDDSNGKKETDDDDDEEKGPITEADKENTRAMEEMVKSFLRNQLLYERRK